MTVTASSFRGDFPEFTSTTVYPDTQINFWLGLSAKLLNADRWGDVLDYGSELFVAHNLVLGMLDQRASASGAIPGAVASGIVSAKSVDKVSVSYDTATAAELDAGHWNLTTYGTRYIRLARLMGAGPLQVGAGCVDSVSAVVGAWPGPYTWPF